MAKDRSTDTEKTDETDGLPAMVVGKWSSEKHGKLGAYINASRKARARFHYSSYIDLFCGPGRVVERGTKTFRDGGALMAWKTSVHGGSPFSMLFLADANAAAVNHCQARLSHFSAPVTAFVGPAARTVDDVLGNLPSGLHLAFLDPFNAEHLDFSIIQRLAKHQHIDILVHVSVMDIQRNIDLEAASMGTRFDRFAPGWQSAVDLTKIPKTKFVDALLDYWESLVIDLARMKAARARPLIVNSNNGPLYRLVLLHRHDLAERLWNDVGETKSQKDLFD